MHQCILKFCIISLCLINKLFINIYIPGKASAQDWSMLLRKPNDPELIEERGYLPTKQSQEDDDDTNNPCPLAKNGEIARQPWDVNSVHGNSKPWINLNSPDINNINNDKYNEQESDTNCKDSASDVVIKILFNRDEPCDKKKTVVQFDQNSKYQVFSKPGINVNISNAHNNMWNK